MMKEFLKITPVNGFDRCNLDNARQNNYAWSMAELGDYIYVGTGRNIVYSVIASGVIGDIEPPKEFTPEKVDMNGEIWRYKKDGSKHWELVYKAPKDKGVMGFRFMIKFTTECGEEGLYAGAASYLGKIYIAKFTECSGWKLLDTGITVGNSTRSMVIQNGKLYMSVIYDNVDGKEELPFIYESADPEKDVWKLVTGHGEKGKNPSGAVIIMEVFNNRVYAGVGSSQGFEIWKTKGETPENNNWELVVDKGAGDALNEIPLSMGTFGDYLYVGTALYFGILSVDPNIGYVYPKGFDIIRIDKNNNWQLVVGGQARKPTKPTKGSRTPAMSGIPSGFGFITNGYCWQIQEFKGELYVGTWDWSVLILPIYKAIIESNGKTILDIIDNTTIKFIFKNPKLVVLLVLLLYPLLGFDLYKTKDGKCWETISLNGFCNCENYGVRKLFKSQDGKLYLGIANPFSGCQVFKKF